MNSLSLNKKEIKKLFSIVEEQKQKGKSVQSAFKLFASEKNRKPNSVRNFYYAYLRIMENNSHLANELEIDLNSHKKHIIKCFNKEDEKELISNIEKHIKNGYSVRKACLILSNGNVSEMVRLQNKYRNIKSIKNSNNDKTDKGNSNIIAMPQKSNALTDNDINSLFLGLIKIVKKNALENASSVLKKQTEFANEMLRKTMVELCKKDSELKRLRQDFVILEKSNQDIKNQLEKLRFKKAEALSKKIKNKMDTLKKYSQNTKTGT